MNAILWLFEENFPPIYKLTGPWFGALLALFVGVGTMNIARIYYKEGIPEVNLRYWNSFTWGEGFFLVLFALFTGLAFQGESVPNGWYSKIYLVPGLIILGRLGAYLNHLSGKYVFKREPKALDAKTERWHKKYVFPAHFILIGTSIGALIDMIPNAWAICALCSLGGLGISALSDIGKRPLPPPTASRR